MKFPETAGSCSVVSPKYFLELNHNSLKSHSQRWGSKERERERERERACPQVGKRENRTTSKKGMIFVGYITKKSHEISIDKQFMYAYIQFLLLTVWHDHINL
ncbi:hypothetical protein ACJX0J_036240, partial [Zea mays]